MDFSSHSILWVLVIGLVVGAIAKLMMPGKDPGGCIITILLGIAGAFVGTWVGRIFAGDNYVAGWIMSVVGALILLLLYRFLFTRGSYFAAGCFAHSFHRSLQTRLPAESVFRLLESMIPDRSSR